MVRQDRELFESYIKSTRDLLTAAAANNTAVVQANFADSGAFRQRAVAVESQLQKHVDYNWQLGDVLREKTSRHIKSC
jgi:methyl-accepting chemotaxis protein